MESNINKRVKIYRVPTKEKTDVYINTYITSKHDSNPLIHIKDITKGTTSDVRELMERGYIPQHLHFTTDEDIKEGDWVLWIKEKRVFQAQKGWNPRINLDCRKIVATTDESLEISLGKPYVADMGVIINPRKRLPQPPQPFVEEYVELGGIDEVLIECDWWDIKGVDTYLPKVNSHNTITIHPVKDSWSREEHIANLEAVMALGISYQKHGSKLTASQELKGWIKENL